jgi:hypothetical protein
MYGMTALFVSGGHQVRVCGLVLQKTLSPPLNFSAEFFGGLYSADFLSGGFSPADFRGRPIAGRNFGGRSFVNSLA